MAGFISSVMPWPNIQLTACSALCRSFNSFISSVVTFFDMDNTSLLLRSLVLIIPTTKMLLILSFYWETAWKRYKLVVSNENTGGVNVTAILLHNKDIQLKDRKCNFMHRTRVGLFLEVEASYPVFSCAQKLLQECATFPSQSLVEQLVHYLKNLIS